MNSRFRIFGGSLLVAGSSIGAGMLALPILTGLAGFFPSIFTLALAWLFMTFTSLLLVEMNAWFSERVNFLSMIEKSLGSLGKAVCFISYLFLFYSLLVAYISASGQIFSELVEGYLGVFFPDYLVSLGFVLIFGWMVFLGTEITDFFNRFLMLGLGLAFFSMWVFGYEKIALTHLLHKDLSYLWLSLPVLVLSFGFQNMIPSISDYLKGNWSQVRLTILCGSGLIFLTYVLWEILLMGIVPFSGEGGILSIYEEQKEASAALSMQSIGPFARAFAFFAIVTSFLAQTLTLMHFLADALQSSFKRKNRFFLVLLTLFPPLVFSIIYPKIFYQAIDFAGGICAMVLFGFLPILAVWRGRYVEKISSSYQVFGGKTALILASFFALMIFLRECLNLFGRVF